ncbi:MAG: hypothetical protein LBJ20_00905 [Candidatus Methanoplasma sp.]|jgi:hypothetical protein|nr:hypothetical protein [Candidatus Methanoplasma sp.]
MRKIILAIAAVMAIAAVASAFAVMDSDDSDAAITLSGVSGVSFDYEFTTIDNAGVSVSSGTIPPGLGLGKVNSKTAHIYGMPYEAGYYEFTVKILWPNKNTVYETYHIHIENPAPVYVDVTYYGNGGLLKGVSEYVEKVVYGTNANLNYVPVMSDGSHTFRGWGTSLSSGVITSLTPTSNASLYALWTQNSASVSSWSATVPHMQGFSNTFTTNPSSASISISSAPSGWGVSVIGKTLSGSVPDKISPNNYTILLQISASGWMTTTYSVVITVPVYVVPPIEDVAYVGDTYFYEPITNPTNSNISIVSVRLGSSVLSNSGAAVSGRTISLPIQSAGTYEITYRASSGGYVSSNAVVRISASLPPVQFDPPSIASITAVQRADESRIWDFTAVNASNYLSISWSTSGSVFQTSSQTAVYEFQTSGVYTVRCTLTGFDASSVYKEATVVVIDSFYPELSWSGVPYSVVVSGSPSVNVSSVPWLTSAPQTVGSSTYTLISGTPSSGNIGSSFTYSVGGQNSTVTVYAAETSVVEPSFEIEYSDENMTVSVDWTGLNASVVYYDYGDGSPITESSTHTYSVSDSFVLKVIGVNNLGERVLSDLVFTGGYGDPIPSTEPTSLTDISVLKGERVWVPLTLNTGDIVSLFGSATSFLQLVDDVIVGETADVDIGEYSLIVNVVSSANVLSQHTVKVTVGSPEVPEEEGDSGFDIPWLLIAILVILVIFVLAVI